MILRTLTQCVVDEGYANILRLDKMKSFGSYSNKRG